METITPKRTSGYYYMPCMDWEIQSRYPVIPDADRRRATSSVVMGIVKPGMIVNKPPSARKYVPIGRLCLRALPPRDGRRDFELVITERSDLLPCEQVLARHCELHKTIVPTGLRARDPKSYSVLLRLDHDRRVSLQMVTAASILFQENDLRFGDPLLRSRGLARFIASGRCHTRRFLKRGDPETWVSHEERIESELHRLAEKAIAATAHPHAA